MNKIDLSKKNKELSKYYKKFITVLTYGCAWVALSAGSGLAQSVAQTGVQTGVKASVAQGLDEIIVTAEKRQGTVMETPLSITAITGADMVAQGITNLSALSQQVPGISLRSAGPGQTEFEMRGLSSSGGSAPTVGFYLDETPLAPPAAAFNGKVVIDPDLYDLARVEVLRGPQGTLYGSGSMGGTIKLVTNQPDPGGLDASVNIGLSGTRGGGFNHRENAMINLPIVPDRVALRAVFTENFVDGWLHRVVLNPFPLTLDGGATRGDVTHAPVAQDFKHANTEQLYSGRAALLIRATDRLTLTPAFFYQKITQGGANTFDNPPGADQGLFGHYQPFDVKEPFSDEFYLFSLPMTYNFDNFRVDTATSYWHRSENQTQDLSEPMQALFGFPAYDGADGGLGPASLTEIDSSRQFAQELRLSSTGEGPFQWLVGGFYSDFKSIYQTASFVPGFIPLGFGTTNLSSIYQPSRIKQYALFSEESYRLTSKLKATVGLRWYSYNSRVYTSASGISTASGGDEATISSAKASNSGFNPKFNLSYTAGKDLLLYGQVAKGFRPGGGNEPVPTTGPVQCLTGPGNLQSLGVTSAPDQFKPDSVWSYEIGEKARLLDNRVTINGAGYYEKWNNIQQLVAPACGFDYTDNAGSAKVYGGELEVQAKITRELRLQANGTYAHATYSESVLRTGTVEGQRVQNIPKYSGSISLIYTAELGDDYHLSTRLTDTYTGSREDITYTRNEVPGYNLVNARLGLMKNNWSLDLFADNLTNKRAFISNTNALSLNLPYFNRVATNQPLTVGLSFTYNMK